MVAMRVFRTFVLLGRNAGCVTCTQVLAGTGFVSRHCYMSPVVGKPDFRPCDNKGADQLRGNREADRRF